MESCKDLEEAVWKQDRCTRCGACVAVCPSKTIIFRDMAPVYCGSCRVLVDNIPCGACFGGCGKAAENEMAAPKKYIAIHAARAQEQVAGAASGGAVTAMLAHALESGSVDGVLLLGADTISKKPVSVVATDAGELRRFAGSRYSWGNALESLGDAVKAGFTRLAAVGTPCAIRSVRRIMGSDLDVLACYGKCIRFTVGLFCTGIFRDVEGAVCRELGISPWQIRKVELRGDRVHVHTGNSVEDVPLATIRSDMLAGCPKCTDFAARFADVSAGNTGSAEGYTTLVVRTDAGAALVAGASDSGRLLLSDGIDIAAIERAAKRKGGRL